VPADPQADFRMTASHAFLQSPKCYHRSPFRAMQWSTSRLRRSQTPGVGKQETGDRRQKAGARSRNRQGVDKDGFANFHFPVSNSDCTTDIQSATWWWVRLALCSGGRSLPRGAGTAVFGWLAFPALPSGAGFGRRFSKLTQNPKGESVDFGMGRVLALWHCKISL